MGSIIDLLVYYELIGDYFSLCNLLAYYKKDLYKFERAIIEGLNKAGHEKNIRAIKYLSKLISGVYKKNHTAKNKIFYKIKSIVSSECDPKLLHEFKIHEGELRATLLKSDDILTGEIDFILSSRNTKNEIYHAVEFAGLLNSLIQERCNAVELNALKISKNSPITIVFSFISEHHTLLTELLAFVASTITILEMGKKLWIKAQEEPLLANRETLPPEQKMDIFIEEKEIKITKGNVYFEGKKELYKEYKKQIIKRTKIISGKS